MGCGASLPAREAGYDYEAAADNARSESRTHVPAPAESTVTVTRPTLQEWEKNDGPQDRRLPIMQELRHRSRVLVIDILDTLQTPAFQIGGIVIVWGHILALFVLVVLICVVIFICRRKKRQLKAKEEVVVDQPIEIVIQ